MKTIRKKKRNYQHFSDLEKNRVKEVSCLDILRASGHTPKRSGGNWVIPCPFHVERTASFTVHVRSNHCHCYGCGIHMDSIELAKRLHNLDFAGAMVYLGAHPEDKNECLTIKQQSERALVNTLAKHRKREEAFQERQKQSLIAKIRRNRERIIREYPWPFEEMPKDSPITIESDHRNHWKQLFSTIYPHDIVLWTGNPEDSGTPEHARNFRTAGQWLASGPAGKHTCPSVFTSGCYQRRNDTVIAKPYLVLDFDDAIGKKPETPEEVEQNLKAGAALTRFLGEVIGMFLVAVIHTGNKSVHSWFCMPNPSLFDDLQVIAKAGVFGIDSSLFTLSQPCRLPGFLHEKSNQPSKLYYLAS